MSGPCSRWFRRVFSVRHDGGVKRERFDCCPQLIQCVQNGAVPRTALCRAFQHPLRPLETLGRQLRPMQIGLPSACVYQMDRVVDCVREGVRSHALPHHRTLNRLAAQTRTPLQEVRDNRFVLCEAIVVIGPSATVLDGKPSPLDVNPQRGSQGEGVAAIFIPKHSLSWTVIVSRLLVCAHIVSRSRNL
jgi:hypothetical protein